MCNSISISKARARSLAAAKARGNTKCKFKGDPGTFRQGLKILSEAAVIVEERSRVSSHYQEKATQRPPNSGQEPGNICMFSGDECEEILDNVFRDVDSSFFHFPPKTASCEDTNHTHTLQSRAGLATKDVNSQSVSRNKSRSRAVDYRNKSVRFEPIQTTSTFSGRTRQI